MDTLQTLEKGLKALELIALKNGQYTVPQLAQQLEINRTTTYKVVNTLVQMRYVRINKDLKVELCSKVADFYHCYESTIPATAQTVLSELAAQTQACTALVTAEGNECVVIKTASPPHSYLQINYHLGSRHPLGVSAAGLMLAAGDPNSLLDNEDVKRARQQHYAYSENVLQAGASGLFVAIPHRPRMVIGMITLGKVNIDESLPLLQRAAALLSS